MCIRDRPYENAFPDENCWFSGLLGELAWAKKGQTNKMTICRKTRDVCACMCTHMCICVCVCVCTVCVYMQVQAKFSKSVLQTFECLHHCIINMLVFNIYRFLWLLSPTFLLPSPSQAFGTQFTTAFPVLLSSVTAFAYLHLSIYLYRWPMTLVST